MLRCASTQEGVRFKDLETTEVWKFLNKHIRESKGVLQPNRGWKIPLGQGTGEHQWLELSRASKTAYKLLNHFKPSGSSHLTLKVLKAEQYGLAADFLLARWENAATRRQVQEVTVFLASAEHWWPGNRPM